MADGHNKFNITKTNIIYGSIIEKMYNCRIAELQFCCLSF